MDLSLIVDDDAFAALVLFNVIKSMGWEDKTGHYIYYKLGLKKPKKNTLAVFTPSHFKQHITTLDDELKITNPDKYNKLRMIGFTYEHSSSSSDDEDEIIKIPTIDDFDPNFKFNRKSPYTDIVNTHSLPDHELARVISLRSQLTTDVWDMCIY